MIACNTVPFTHKWPHNYSDRLLNFFLLLTQYDRELRTQSGFSQTTTTTTTTTGRIVSRKLAISVMDLFEFRKKREYDFIPPSKFEQSISELLLLLFFFSFKLFECIFSRKRETTLFRWRIFLGRLRNSRTKRSIFVSYEKS